VLTGQPLSLLKLGEFLVRLLLVFLLDVLKLTPLLGVLLGQFVDLTLGELESPLDVIGIFVRGIVLDFLCPGLGLGSRLRLGIEDVVVLLFVLTAHVGISPLG
jgi:hypothetical protein